MRIIIGVLFLSVFFVRLQEEARAQKGLGVSARLFQSVRPLVFQIKTAVSKDSPKSSYGSGWVVDKKGLLMTNYHVISSALQDEDKQYKVFVTIKGKTYQVKVVAFDVVNDLALLKIDYRFRRDLRLNLKKMKQGQKLYSLGLPKDLNLSIVEGVYNGIIKQGIYENILMSSPINSGMSGGPTVNRKGEVVGVNVSILLESQNISFCVPVHLVTKLLKRYRTQGEIDLKKGLHKEIERQLTKVQEALMEGIFKSKGKTKSIGRWTFAPPPHSLKPWSSNENDKNKTVNIRKQVYYLSKASFIKDETYSGSYEIRLQSLKNKKSNGVLQ